MKGRNIYFTREQLMILRDIVINDTLVERKLGKEAHERGDNHALKRADYMYSIGVELSIKINDAIGKTPSIHSTAQMMLPEDDEVPF